MYVEISNSKVKTIRTKIYKKFSKINQIFLFTLNKYFYFQITWILTRNNLDIKLIANLEKFFAFTFEGSIFPDIHKTMSLFSFFRRPLGSFIVSLLQPW